MPAASKPGICPACRGQLEDDGSCSCGFQQRAKRGSRVDGPQYDLQCAWDDYGRRCGLRGCISDSGNGSGPWFCSDHYWHGLRKLPRREGESDPEAYRKRWYENRGLTYRLPNRNGTNELKAPALPAIREPGQDDEELSVEVSA